MSETIWSFRVGGSIAGRALAYGFIAFLALLLLLVALTSPPQYRLNNALGMAIFLAPLIAAALVIDRGFSRPFEVRFTEDGLAVGGGGGFTCRGMRLLAAAWFVSGGHPWAWSCASPTGWLITQSH